ncbi:MAG: hypothetical protein NDI61_10865 [Bdellovibrionaceae bacterium]|nr:hypothetical protein [Pseudobdellovibrionaceae bacterium]
MARFSFVFSALLAFLVGSNFSVRASEFSSPLSTAKPNAADRSCLLCDLKPSMTLPNHFLNQACEDLHVATCVDGRGQESQQSQLKNLEAQLRGTVSRARQVTLRAMGFQDEADAIRKSLARQGIELKSELSQKARRFVFDNDLSSYVPDSELYAVTSKCEARAAELRSISTYMQSDLVKLREHRDQIRAFFAEVKRQRNFAVSLVLPGFFKQIAAKCGTLQALDEKVQAASQYVRLKNVCASLPQLRRRVLDLYRKQEAPEARQQALALVTEHSDVLDVQVTENVTENITTTQSASAPTSNLMVSLGLDDPASALRTEIASLTDGLYNSCENVASGFRDSMAPTRETVLKKANLARPTIEALIETYYSETTKSTLLKMLERVKLGAMRVVRRITPDQKLQNKIQQQYQQLELGWFKKPASEAYVRDPNSGIEYLDEDTTSPTDDLFLSLSDADLSTFTSLDAFYRPSGSVGVFQSVASVNLMPAFLRMTEQNPHGSLSILAHEVSHLIGPRMSVINGHDMRAAHRPLLTCLSSPESIRLQPQQADEAVADMVAAEIMAELISELPEQERLNAVASALQPLCLMEDGRVLRLFFDDNGSHPSPILRMSGLFGASPALRRAMGCERESQAFRSCSWKGDQ